MEERGVALLVGATGYVGGRLAPLLLEQGFRVRSAETAAPIGRGANA